MLKKIQTMHRLYKQNTVITQTEDKLTKNDLSSVYLFWWYPEKSAIHRPYGET